MQSEITKDLERMVDAWIRREWGEASDSNFAAYLEHLAETIRKSEQTSD